MNILVDNNVVVDTMLSLDMTIRLVLDNTGELCNDFVLSLVTHSFFIVFIKPSAHSLKQFKSSPELEL